MDVVSNLRTEDLTAPEPFLWFLLECLCIVGLLLERGEVIRNPMSDWKTIIHRDIKLSVSGSHKDLRLVRTALTC